MKDNLTITWDDGKYYVPAWIRIEYYQPLAEELLSGKYGGRPGRPVCYVDHEGELIEAFPSIRGAARATGAFHSAIIQAIKRKGTCMGFKWEYL